MSEKIYDLAIIGGGPGGYVAAIRASQLGMNTVVIEANHLGGICLNWGCIPTKALLRTAEVYHLMQNASEFGLKAEKISFDFDKIIERSRAISAKLSSGVSHLMKKNKIDVLTGRAKLAGRSGSNHKLEVTHDGKKLPNVVASKVIIATGAHARSLPGLEPDGQDIWTYKEAMVPKKLPKSLLVIGSGAIGIEFASFYNALGTDVTVVEVMDRILPVEDEEISTFARKAFEKRGIKIHTGVAVKDLKKSSKGVTATIGKETIAVEKVILAVGIAGNVEDLGLEGTKIQVEKSHIKIDKWCQTDEPGIYAIGDVAGAPWLAHKASHEGILAVERIANVKDIHPIDTNIIPGCTYSDPQIASIGLTEKQARAKGHRVKVGRFPYIANGKAIALGETEGLVKTIFDQTTGELLGAHLVGAEVTELIQGFGIAKNLEATEAELMHTIFPHPTLSEMMHESVLDAFDKAVHI